MAQPPPRGPPPTKTWTFPPGMGGGHLDLAEERATFLNASPELQVIGNQFRGPTIRVWYDNDNTGQIQLESTTGLGLIYVYQNYQTGGQSTFSTRHYQASYLENGVERRFDTVQEVITYMNRIFLPASMTAQILDLHHRLLAMEAKATPTYCSPKPKRV